MVLIFDGSSELGAHVCSVIGNSICLRHSLRSKAVAHLMYISEKSCFPSHVRVHVLSYHLIISPMSRSSIQEWTVYYITGRILSNGYPVFELGRIAEIRQKTEYVIRQDTGLSGQIISGRTPFIRSNFQLDTGYPALQIYS